MSKHTSGPWTASPRQDGLYNIYAGPHDVALCVRPSNAALIAAAPDLLAALQSMLEGNHNQQDVRESARAAITKATGTD